MQAERPRTHAFPTRRTQPEWPLAAVNLPKDKHFYSTGATKCLTHASPAAAAVRALTHVHRGSGMAFPSL